MNANIRRYGWFILGVVLNSFGIALITKAALGTSPISSLPYVLSFAFAPSLGQFTFLVNLLFIAGQALLVGRLVNLCNRRLPLIAAIAGLKG